MRRVAAIGRCPLVVLAVLLVTLAAPPPAAAQQQNWNQCDNLCYSGMDCNIQCFYNGNFTTCGQYGSCVYPQCWSGCDRFSSCGTTCWDAGFNSARSCGDYGTCNMPECWSACNQNVPCGTSCWDRVRGRESTCGDSGLCGRALCTTTCTASTPCTGPEGECYLSDDASSKTTCAAFTGVCGQGGGGGGGSLSPCEYTCSVYSRCDKQCIYPLGTNHVYTCGQYAVCGQCEPDEVWLRYTPYWMNGYCVGDSYEPIYEPNGVICQFIGPTVPPDGLCPYLCRIECPNLR